MCRIGPCDTDKEGEPLQKVIWPKSEEETKIKSGYTGDYDPEEEGGGNCEENVEQR